MDGAGDIFTSLKGHHHSSVVSRRGADAVVDAGRRRVTVGLDGQPEGTLQRLSHRVDADEPQARDAAPLQDGGTAWRQRGHGGLPTLKMTKFSTLSMSIVLPVDFYATYTS